MIDDISLMISNCSCDIQGRGNIHVKGYLARLFCLGQMGIFVPGGDSTTGQHLDELKGNFALLSQSAASQRHQKKGQTEVR